MSGSFSVRFDGSARKTLAGTIAVTNGSATVTGTGTSFTTLQANDYILIDAMWYRIASITSATSLTLEEPYRGASASGLPMRGQSMSVGGCLENIVVVGAAAECLRMVQALGCQVRDCVFRSGGVAATTPAVQVIDSGLSIFDAIWVESGRFTGILVTSSQGIGISKTVVSNCNGIGIEINDCLAAVLTELFVQQNNGNGVLFSGTSNRCSIDASLVIRNTSNGIADSGSGNVIVSNRIHSNGGHGIFVRTGSANSIVIGNRCATNGLTGITVEVGAMRTIVQDNQVTGNTVDSIVDNGTNTRIAVSEATLDADQFELPVNLGWAVPALAPIVPDSANADIPVARLDDTIEEGFGFSAQIPPLVTKLRLTFWSKCVTAPTSPNVNVGPRLYTQEIIGNSTAVGAWSAPTALSVITFPAGAQGTNFLKSVQTLNLATLGLTPGRKYKFEITRNPNVANDVVGDWAVAQVKVEFF
jgi:hypothetical protein